MCTVGSGRSPWLSPRVRALCRTGAGFGVAVRLGAKPKGMVSGRGAAVLKGQQETGPRVRAGASRLARGPGRTGVGITGPYICPHWVRGAKPQPRASRRDGRSYAQSPHENMSTSPPCPRAQPEPTSLPPLARGQRGLAEPGRSRSRNPERIHPAFPGLAPENRLSFPLAPFAAITQETLAGPPISLGSVWVAGSCSPEGRSLGEESAKSGTQPGHWVSS